LAVILAALGRTAFTRAAVVVSVFVLLFFSYPVARAIAGSGVAPIVLFGAATSAGCSAGWLLGSWPLASRFWLLMLSVALCASCPNYAHRLARVEAQAATSRGKDNPITPSAAPRHAARFEYPLLGSAVAVLPADPARAAPENGASFLGLNFTP